MTIPWHPKIVFHSCAEGVAASGLGSDYMLGPGLLGEIPAFLTSWILRVWELGLDQGILDAYS